MIFAVLTTRTVIVIIVVVVIFDPISGFPGHFVLLFEPPSRVGEPRRHLSQGHFGDDGQHDFLALGGVGVLFVLVEPRLKGARRLPGGVFAPGAVEVHSVPVDTRELGNLSKFRFAEETRVEVFLLFHSGRKKEAARGVIGVERVIKHDSF
jgi:hypothetical protein